MRTILNRTLMLLLGALLCACAPAARQTSAQLSGKGQFEITISGFRNDLGEALIYLYKSEAGFPDAEAPDLMRLHRSIQSGQVFIRLENLAFGHYAISILHDENLDGQMNKSLLGFPREGFGFSRNPNLSHGPPAFIDVRFLFAADGQQQTVEMQYQTLRKNEPERSKRPPGAG